MGDFLLAMGLIMAFFVSGSAYFVYADHKNRRNSPPPKP